MSASENEANAPTNPGGTPPMISPSTPGSANDDVQVAKSRRRRRPAGSENLAKNQAFYFVDSSSSSKEKRAHVMRHHVQEKRKQRKRSHGTISSENMQEVASWQAGPDCGYDTDTIQEPVGASVSGAPVEQDSSLPIRFSTVNPHSHPTPMHVDPLTTVDSSSKDPSLSLPFAQSPEDLELIDYWASKLTYWSGQNSYIKTQVFGTAAQHYVPFQAAILTYCARWKAQLQGTPNSEEVRRHVSLARKNIMDATTGSLQVHPDHIVFALSGLALSEDRFGDKQQAQAYLDQASRIMRPRTGTNFLVEGFLHYVRFILPPPMPAVDLASLNWLISFLRGAEQLMYFHSAPEYHAQAPQRRDAFQMECSLFTVLSSGPRPSQVPYASRMYVIRDPETQEVSRTVSLIYITAALWDFKDSPDRTNRFLIYLKSIVDEHELARHPACETLMYLLLEQGCDGDLQNPERAWSAGELLRTHRLLRPELRFQFNEILMSFLTLRSPIRGLDVFEEELRNEHK